MTRDELDAAYRRTTYVAVGGTGPIELRIGEKHPALDAVLSAEEVSEWAYITAWNPYSTAASADANALAQRRLEQALEERGVRFLRGKSRPDEDFPGEESLLAFVSRDEAAALGAAFDQNAIVVGRMGECAALLWLR